MSDWAINWSMLSALTEPPYCTTTSGYPTQLLIRPQMRLASAAPQVLPVPIAQIGS